MADPRSVRVPGNLGRPCQLILLASALALLPGCELLNVGTVPARPVPVIGPEPDPQPPGQTGEVAPDPPAGPSSAGDLQTQPRGRRGGRWRAGADALLEGLYFPDFGNRVADQPNLTRSEGEDFVPTLGVGLKVGYGASPWHLRLHGHQVNQDIEQDYEGGGPLFPTMARGSVRGRFLSAMAGYELFLGLAMLDLFAGPTWAQNKMDLLYTYAEAEQTSSRVESGMKWTAGAEVGIPIWVRWSLLLGLGYTGGSKSEDADRNVRAYTGVRFNAF